MFSDISVPIFEDNTVEGTIGGRRNRKEKELNFFSELPRRSDNLDYGRITGNNHSHKLRVCYALVEIQTDNVVEQFEKRFIMMDLHVG